MMVVFLDSGMIDNLFVIIHPTTSTEMKYRDVKMVVYNETLNHYPNHELNHLLNDTLNDALIDVVNDTLNNTLHEHDFLLHNTTNDWYYGLGCDQWKDNADDRYSQNMTKINNYKRLRVKCAMQYLQHEIFPYVTMEKKSFIESNLDLFVKDFHCGYSTLTSHQCPVVKARYQCPGLNDRLFEEYTIALSKKKLKNKTNNNFTNTFFDKYFSNDIEQKFLKRLFENGTFFNNYNGKKKTILIIGTSHLRQLSEEILCILIQFNFTNIKLWKNLNDDELVNHYNNLNYNNNKKWQVEIKTQRIDFNKVIQEPKFLKSYLKKEYSNISNLTNYEWGAHEPENKFKIFKEKAFYNCDFDEINNDTSPCLGYDGYGANYAYQTYLNKTLKQFVFENTNWNNNMYSNISIDNLLNNNIFCKDDQSVVSFTNDKLNIFYFAVTQQRLDLYRHLTKSIVYNKRYVEMLSRYGYKNGLQFLNDIDLIIANQGFSRSGPRYDMLYDLFDDRDKLYQYLYNNTNTNIDKKSGNDSINNNNKFIPIIGTSNWNKPRL